MILLLLKASILLAVLYLFYKVVLERESFFAVNRVYLIGSLALCFVLPFISLPLFTTHQGIVTTSYERLAVPESTIELPEQMHSQSSVEAAPLPNLESAPQANSAIHSNATPSSSSVKSLPDWRSWISYAYLFGVAIFLFRFLTQIGSLVLRIRSSQDRIIDTDSQKKIQRKCNKNQ